MGNIRVLQKKGTTPKPLLSKDNRICPLRDTIIKRTMEVKEVDKDGNVVIKRKTKEVNMTKVTNESAKVLNQTTAADKLAEIEAIFTK